MIRHSSLLSDALAALREHPLRSLLSVVGLVIGVASLVAILALLDGTERYARDRIRTTTDLQYIGVAPRTVERIDGLTLRRDSVEVFTAADADALVRHLGRSATVAFVQQRPVEIRMDSVHTAAMLFAADTALWALRSVEVRSGRLFDAADVDSAHRVVVLSDELASRLGNAPAALIGQEIRIKGVAATVIGVLASDAARPAELYGPVSAFLGETEEHLPSLYLRAERAEEVRAVVERVRAWLNERFARGSGGFVISTNEERAEQIREGMMLFKLIFGLITGISVLVGGIGVMNVLLVSVTERTREIGIRKAVGARQRDILLQFLAEALTVASFGSVVGLVVGLLGVFTLVPLIHHFTDVTLHAVLTGQTLIVVGALAVLVGVLSGTYPAVRAARLTPVDAIRQE